MTIRILLADDQDDVRGAFKIILDSQPDMTVVAEAADGTAAVELARHVRPDVAVLDIRMPGLDGLEVTRRLSGPGVADRVPVVLVTTFELDEYIHAALRYGAYGYVLKRSTGLLAEAVRSAFVGENLISPSITTRLLRHYRAPAAQEVRLTERETDIVRVLAEGRTNAEIGTELRLAAGTVKNHVAAIQRKLGVSNRVGVAMWAWDSGLVKRD